MEDEEALRIVRALADGVNPVTGEVCRAESIFQEPQAIRALETAAAAIHSKIGRERKKKRLPTNVGKPWQKSEEAQLCAEFERGMSVWHIARIHDRTRGGITARLERLGKMAPISSPETDAARPEAKVASAIYPGTPWLPEEDQRLCAEFYRAHDFAVIEAQIGRPRSEIYQRLVFLGKIKPKASPVDGSALPLDQVQRHAS